MNNLKEYELFTNRTQRLSERRQSATQTYLTVSTAIFGILVFLVKDAGLTGWGFVISSLPLFSVGVLSCVIWHRIIVQFKTIIGWHYTQLRKMEDEIDDSFKVFYREWDEFFKPKQGEEKFGFSNLELWLPRLLFGLYIIYYLGVIYAVAKGIL